MADPHAPPPKATIIAPHETVTPKVDTHTLHQKVVALYAHRADIQPRPDDRPRLPALVMGDTASLEQLLQQYLGQELVPANDTSPKHEPVELDIELEAALLAYLYDTSVPANDVTPAAGDVAPTEDVEPDPNGRYTHVDEDLISTLPPRSR